jgi:hypothetical protein
MIEEIIGKIEDVLKEFLEKTGVEEIVVREGSFTDYEDKIQRVRTFYGFTVKPEDKPLLFDTLYKICSFAGYGEPIALILSTDGIHIKVRNSIIDVHKNEEIGYTISVHRLLEVLQDFLKKAEENSRTKVLEIVSSEIEGAKKLLQ